MISNAQISRNFLIQGAGKILSVVIGLVLVAIITRALGPSAFGEYSTAIVFLQLFGVIVDFGLTLTLVVMLSEKGVDESNVASNILSMRMLSGAILFAVAPLIVLVFPWSTTIKYAVAVGALAYILMSGASILNGIFQRHAVMWRAALGELVGRIILVAGVALVALVSANVIAMVAVAIISNLVWFILMIALCRPYVRLRPAFDWPLWKETWTRSWPIAISIIANLIYLKGDVVFLALFRSQEEVGLYNLAYRFIDVLTVLPAMFMGLLLPALTHAWNKKTPEEFQERLSQTFNVFMLFTLPLIFGAQVVGRDLAIFLSGEAYAASGTVLQLLIVAMIGVFISGLYGHAVVAIGKQRQMIAGYVGVALLAILGYLWLIPSHGMWGAVWVTLATEGIIAFLTFLVVARATKHLPRPAVTLKALVASLVMYSVLIWLPAFAHVTLTICVGALIYTLVIFALRAVRVDQLKALLRP